MSKEGYFGTAIELLAISAGVWLQMTETIPLIVGYPIIVLCAIGGAVLITIGVRKKENIRNIGNKALLEDIKSDLVNMNMWQREEAIKKVEQPCSKEIALQICDDFIAVFEARITIDEPFDIEKIKKEAVKLPLYQKALHRNIDALIEFFKTFGDILDNNNYGLKTTLENNELYKASRIDLAQKRIRLKMRKRKKFITQSNIDRVISLSYGLASTILLRGILKSSPEANRTVPPVVRITLESTETRGEKVMTVMLDDLENEWKVNVDNELQILPF